MVLWRVQHGQILHQNVDSVLKVDEMWTAVLKKVEQKLYPPSVALAIYGTRTSESKIETVWRVELSTLW